MIRRLLGRREQPLDCIIPDFDGLIRAVLAGATHKDSVYHGIAHWQRVAWTGYSLLNEVPTADRAVVFLFGLLHDSKRENDGHDPEHGVRAATFVRQLHGSHFRLPKDRLELLVDACYRHADGEITDDPTVGVCRDADRLNLWRVGVRPDPRWLSTAAARRELRIEWADTIQDRRFSWPTLGSAFGLR